jgi:hypothetical protein
MKRVMLCAAVAAAVALSGAARASEPCGIFARVDKVEVGADKDWIKIEGDFCIALDTGRTTKPHSGVLYFSIVKGKEAICHAEWADLETIAQEKDVGKRYVAFGSHFTHGLYVAVHEKIGADTKPEPYPLNHGLSRLRSTQLGSSDDSPNPVRMLQKYREQKDKNK